MSVITCRLYEQGKLSSKDLDVADISEVIGRPNVLIWLDVPEPTAESLQPLADEFGFHPLAIEDCLQAHERPKIETYDDYYFLVANGFSMKEKHRPVAHELCVFVGKNYMVTVRKTPVVDIGPVVKRWEDHNDLLSEGGAYPLYILLDSLVDGYFDLLDGFEDQTEDVEEEILSDKVQPQTRAQIFTLKKNLLKFRRGASPLREVLDLLTRGDVDLITDKMLPYYRDVYDHVLRATDFADNLRDILTSALDVHLSAVGNRLNEVMKVLTSWAGIILVPTLIAGIYGMNFVHMPELRWRFGYLYALALMGGSALMLFLYFRRRGWL
jgi:magnesium transporter